MQELTQAEVAQAISIDPTTYGRIENGVHEPRLRTILALEKYFNETIEYLLKDVAGKVAG